MHFIIRSILGGENRGGDGDTETTIVDGVLLLLVIDVIGTGTGTAFGSGAISLLLWLIEDRDGCR